MRPFASRHHEATRFRSCRSKWLKPAIDAVEFDPDAIAVERKHHGRSGWCWPDRSSENCLLSGHNLDQSPPTGQRSGQEGPELEGSS